jgi:hypothetical protein
MTISTNLTANEQLALNPGLDIKKYRVVFANGATGKTDLRKVKIALVAVAAKWDVATEVIGLTTRNLRRRLNEILDSSTTGTVKQVTKSPKLTSGEVDKGMVTDTSNFVTKEDLGIFKAEVVSNMEKLADAMALIASAIKS